MLVLHEAQEQEDVYPSRIADEPRMLPRLDPIVYQDSFEESDGPLSTEQLVEFEGRGFLVLPGFLPAEDVDACRTELDRLRHSPDIKKRPEAVIEPEGDELRSLFAAHAISAYFGSLLHEERLTGIARQLLGSDVYVHQSRINLKPGFTGKEFYWHSDFETWHVEDGMPRMRAVSFSIALTPNYAFNGPLMLIPGSHKKYVVCVGKTPERNFESSLRRQEIGVPDHESLRSLAEEGGIEAPTGPAGSLVIFDCNTMHGSNGNITPFPRSNLFAVYNSVENRLRAPYCGLAPRPAHIATRD